MTKLALILLAVAAHAAPVPFVGCAADGQVGPIDAPTGSAVTVDLPADRGEILDRNGSPLAESVSGMRQAAADPDFEAWRKNSVFPHKVQGYSIVTISLKPIGGPPGDATAEQMDALADLAEK